MKRHQDTRPIREQLAGAERGLRQMERTKDRDDRRVMLGCLLFDLVAIEKAMAREGCSTEERILLMKLERRAWEIQRKTGSPIDDPSRPINESRSTLQVRPDRVPPLSRAWMICRE